MPQPYLEGLTDLKNCLGKPSTSITPLNVGVIKLDLCDRNSFVNVAKAFYLYSPLNP